MSKTFGARRGPGRRVVRGRRAAAASSFSAAAAPARASRSGTSSASSSRIAAGCSSTRTRSARSKARSWRACARKIGFLFQNAALFDSISVGENVAFPMRRHTEAAATARSRSGRREKLAAVGLEKRIRQDAGRPLRRHAQARRSRARARARSADRSSSTSRAPASTHHRRRNRRAAARLKQRGGTTLIVVTHNIPSAKRLGDELVMLHEGRIVARGTAADLEQSQRAHGPRVHVLAACRMRLDDKESPGRRWRVRDRWLLLFAVGLFLIGDRRMLFTDTFEVYAEFTQIAALDTGAKVRVAGMDAGEVEEIQRAAGSLGTVPRPDAGARGPASADPARLGRLDPERRPRRQQVRPDPDRHGCGAAGGGQGHDPEPRAVRYRRSDADDERHAGHRQHDAHRRQEAASTQALSRGHRHRQGRADADAGHGRRGPDDADLGQSRQHRPQGHRRATSGRGAARWASCSTTMRSTRASRRSPADARKGRGDRARGERGSARRHRRSARRERPGEGADRRRAADAALGP